MTIFEKLQVFHLGKLQISHLGSDIALDKILRSFHNIISNKIINAEKGLKKFQHNSQIWLLILC